MNSSLITVLQWYANNVVPVLMGLGMAIAY